MEFLKKFGIGILYALFFPVLLMLIALVAVYGALTFVVEFVIMLINFFSGKKCFPVFEEDVEATKRKEEALSSQSPAPEGDKAENKTNNIYVQQVYYNTDPTKMGVPNSMGNPFPQSQMPSSQPLNNQGLQSNQNFQSQPTTFISPNPFQTQEPAQPSPIQIPSSSSSPLSEPDIQELLNRAEKKGDSND